MAGRVLILRWTGSSYDSLGGLLELFAREFASIGLTVLLFNADTPDWPQRLVNVLATEKCTFAITMSGIGVDLSVDGKSIWEAAGVPVFNWNCDHPAYFPRRHGLSNPFVLHGYVFPDHARYAIRHLDANGSAFAVHMGIPPRTLFAGAPLPLQNRNGRIIFAKSGQDTSKIEDGWRHYGTDLRYLVTAAAEESFHLPTAAILPTLQRIGEPRGLFFSGNNLLAMRLIREIDTYIRYKRANLVMRAILRYPVDIFGSGWDHIDTTNAQAKLFGPIAWGAMLQQLPNYIASLSQNPLTEESAHDRVFFALAAGVPPITDGNAFLQARMPALTPYTFDFNPQRIEQAVEAVLADPALAIERSEATWHATKDELGTQQATLQIVQFALLHALNARCSV